MPRYYEKKEGTRRIMYRQDDIARAMIDVQEGMSIRAAATKNKVPHETLRRRLSGTVANPGRSGRGTVLLPMEEEILAQHIAVLGDYGLAFEITDLQRFVRNFLFAKKRRIDRFADGFSPGIDWVHGFLSRKANVLSKRKCQNINRRRAAVSENVISDYFENLKKSLQGISPKYIVNYDETNFVDDPGTKEQIFRRGNKRAERVMNTSKTAVSVMFAATALGEMIPSFVVYKGTKLMDSYLEGGPLNTQYAFSKSGWFDGELFKQYINKIIIPFFKKEPEKKKVLIGDNLPAHMSLEIVEILKQNNISLVFLPPNSTHILQPLDVSVFRPLKIAWRKVLQRFKLNEGKMFTTLPYAYFPNLLLQLMQMVSETFPQNVKSGFRKCGIYPFKPSAVAVTPKPLTPSKRITPEHLTPAFMDFIKNVKETSTEQPKRKRGRKLFVDPGKSVSLKDLEDASTSGNNQRETPQEEIQDLLELPDLEESFDETSSEFNNSDYVLVKFQQGKLKPYFYVGKVLSQIDDKVTVKFLRKAERGKHNENEIAFKDPENVDIFEIEKGQIMKKMIIKDIRRGFIFFKNTCKGLIVR
ncbi:UNVERIFIED_CONTAM: hypothetical protein RMT77_010533 [Armadillidium vulgare]